jgi:hypothetical protein
MDKVDNCCEKIGYTNKQQVTVLYEPSGIPGYYKNARAYQYDENLSYAMEQYIRIQAADIQTPKQSQKQDNL